MIHPLADVKSTKIGLNTSIWQYAVVLAGAQIGEDCNINCHTFIENDVIIGNRVTVKSGVYLWDGIRIEDDVFIGPSVIFTNDTNPRSKQRVPFPPLVVGRGASIGAGSIILPGIKIGEYAMIGAGSLVTRDVEPFSLIYGSPATLQGYVNEKGQKIKNKK